MEPQILFLVLGTGTCLHSTPQREALLHQHETNFQEDHKEPSALHPQVVPSAHTFLLVHGAGPKSVLMGK